MTELKPCPFCGGKAKRYKGEIFMYGVRCTHCGIAINGYSTQGGAVRFWNRRANNG